MITNTQDDTGALPVPSLKAGLVRLLLYVTVYYLALGGFMAGLLLVFPGLHDVLPIGGISDIAESVSGDRIVDAMAVAEGAGHTVWISGALSLGIAMLASVLLMIPVAWVYRAIHLGHDYDHSIDETSLVMPAVIAGVVTVAQHSLALAFSLAGIVAGVRFRRALSDTFDTLFIFVAIGVGLAAGVGAIEVAIVITVFFNYITLTTCVFGDGLESKFRADEERVRKARKATEADSKGKKKNKKKKRDKDKDKDKDKNKNKNKETSVAPMAAQGVEAEMPPTEPADIPTGSDRDTVPADVPAETSLPAPGESSSDDAAPELPRP